MMRLSYNQYCRVCGKLRSAPGVRGAVAHPECSRKMQLAQGKKSGSGAKTTKRMTEKYIERLARIK